MKTKLNKRNYFHGWYFKQANDNNSLAVIPSYHIDGKGNLQAIIQIIWDEGSYVFEFPSQQFFIDKKNMLINIGHNIFSQEGIELNIQTNDNIIKGALTYSNFTPPRYDIMGCFKYLPFMQCRHQVISLKHPVNGFVNINGKQLDFKNGIGYIESDRGSSFPQRYLWTQCNIQKEGEEISIMLSIATIKQLCINFNGAICSIYHNGKEYRLATYLGAKILEFTEKNAKIKQGNMIFRAEQISSKPHPLQAPINGIMKRTIRESPSCEVRYFFSIDDKIIFDLSHNSAGFEYSDNIN